MSLARVLAVSGDLAKALRGLVRHNGMHAAIGEALAAGVEDARDAAALALRGELDEPRVTAVKNRFLLLASAADELAKRGPLVFPEVQRGISHFLALLRPKDRVRVLFVAPRLRSVAAISPRIFAKTVGGTIGIALMDGIPSILTGNNKWLLVAHELAHLLGPLAALADSPTEHRRRAAEFLCDAGGLAFGGPAFSMGMAEYASALGGKEIARVGGRTHPPIEVRRAFLCGEVSALWDDWIAGWIRQCLKCASARAQNGYDEDYSLGKEYLAASHPFRRDSFDKLKIGAGLLSQIRQGESPLHPLTDGLINARNCLGRQ